MERVLEVSAPTSVVEALTEASGQPVPQEMLYGLIGLYSIQAPDLPIGMARAWTMKSFREQLRLLLRFVFLPRDVMAGRYNLPPNSARVYLTYLWRPLDLLLRRAPVTLSVLRGKPAARVQWDRQLWIERWLQGEITADRDRSDDPSGAVCETWDL
jgi:hypothetical protein